MRRVCLAGVAPSLEGAPAGDGGAGPESSSHNAGTTRPGQSRAAASRPMLLPTPFYRPPVHAHLVKVSPGRRASLLTGTTAQGAPSRAPGVRSPPTARTP